jgi:hypothetical protein
LHNQLKTRTYCIFWGEFSPLGNKEIKITIVTEGQKNSELTIFRQYVTTSHQNIAGFINVLLSSLTFSQIWLFSLVDDCQFGYITKLEIKTLLPAMHYGRDIYILG